jgi:hypothetical protein
VGLKERCGMTALEKDGEWKAHIAKILRISKKTMKEIEMSVCPASSVVHHLHFDELMVVFSVSHFAP